MKPLRLYRSSKTPIQKLRERLTTLGAPLLDAELYALSYNDLVELVALAEKRVAIEKEMMEIVAKRMPKKEEKN